MKTRHRGIEMLGTNHYRIRARGMDPRTGREREVDRKVSCGLKEALTLQATWRKEIERGLGERPDRVRLRDYARSWLTTKAPLIKPATRVKYATSLDLHILPALGDYYLDALQPQDVKAWVSGQGQEGLRGWT